MNLETQEISARSIQKRDVSVAHEPGGSHHSDGTQLKHLSVLVVVTVDFSLLALT